MSLPTPEPGWMLEPFGKYVLVRKLAEGGMAEIFLAKQTGVEGFERDVVIKRMLPHLSRQKRFVNMFLDEARLASRLTHNNIVPIFEVGVVDESYYICMEYLAGADLAWILQRALERKLQLPVDVALRIIIAAARGLDHAHHFRGEDGAPVNIVHRDVSPSNLLVSFQGEVKVLDFGIAKAESRITSTRTGTVKGKTHYMAPEQANAAPVDKRCDVYSLGVTLYEALTVWPPFLRENERATFDAVMKNEYRPPRQRRPEIPQIVERACMKAMALDPADRYATCGELADDLAAALDTPPPAGADPLVGRFVRELAGEADVAYKTRVPSLPSLQQSGLRENAERTPVPRRAGRRMLALAAAVTVAALALAGARLWPRMGAPPGCDTLYGDAGRTSLRLGVTIPLSVGGVWTGETGPLELVDALRLALDEINARGGVAGRRLSLRVCDNAGSTPVMKEQVAWLMDHEHVPVLMTSWSSQTLAAVNLTLPRDVMIMTADATSPELAAVPATGPGGVRMLWRTAPSDALQAEVVAELLARDPAFAPAHRVGVLYQDDPYGQGWAGVMQTQLPHLGPGVEVHAIQFPFLGDIDSAVEQLAAVKPDLTVLVAFPVDATRVLDKAAEKPALRRAAGNRWFFVDSIKEPSVFNGLRHPEEIDGAYGIESADGGGPEAASFRARFAARFHRDADEQTYAANRYDSLYAVALAAAWAAGPDGQGALTGPHIAQGLSHLLSGPRTSLTPDAFAQARDALAVGRDIDIVGASGDLDFDVSVGEAYGPFALWRVRGKSFVKDRRLDARLAPAAQKARTR